MRNSSSPGNFAIGFTIGLLGGVCIALLLAPKPGQESRKFVKNRISDFGDDFKVLTTNRKKLYSDTWKQLKVKPYSEEFNH